MEEVVSSVDIVFKSGGNLVDSKRVYIVPHSHWDREWYFSIEDSNIILAENISHLITVLKNDNRFKGYVFDGQLSVIEEFLKVKPENESFIRELIIAKRLFIGPWYTQTDSLLVHKEALVRNLVYGVLGSEAFGHSMNVGYLPDIFGQNRYLPSLFNQLDIDYSILQRGIYTDELNGELHFNWKSPDKLSVKTALLPLGYGPGKFLNVSEDYRQGILYPLIEKIDSLSNQTNHILFPAGGDQVLVRKHFPETVEELNKLDDGYTYILSDYETYMEETWDEIFFSHSIEGELIGTQLSRMHRTICSQRYDIKYWNHIVENQLINHLEPLAIIGEHFGLDYPKNQLDDIWKELFDVHSHDSIGGCNSDETNRAIVERLKKLNRKLEGLLNVIKKQLTMGIIGTDDSSDHFVLFNTRVRISNQPVKTVLFTRNNAFLLENTEKQNVAFSLLSQDYINGGKKIVVTDDGEKQVPLPGYYRSEVLIHEPTIPALGYTVLKITKSSDLVKLNKSERAASIENEKVKLSVEKNTLLLEDKASGLVIRDFITFEDTADAGDSYDYSPLTESQSIIMDSVEFHSVENNNGVKQMRLRHTGQIPLELNERLLEKPKTKEIVIDTTLILYPNEEFIRVKHQLENKLYDHRIRALLNTPVKKAKYSFGDQGYSLITRPVKDDRLIGWKEKGYVEAPVPIYTIERFAGVSGSATPLTVFTKGIKEYEVLDSSNQLAVTLFRSVGLLGRDDLEWRPGRASGINNKVVKTPDAQMIGKWEFNYAIVIGQNDETTLFDLADQYNEQTLSYQYQKLNTFEERLDRFELPSPLNNLPKRFSLFSITEKSIFVSSIKKAEKESGVIVRLYNPTEENLTTEINSPWIDQRIYVNLKEDHQNNCKKKIVVPAKGYQTILLKRKEKTSDRLKPD